MLNTHAAVLEAAFPERSLGAFRSTSSRNRVVFRTYADSGFEQTSSPGSSVARTISIPENTVQATLNVGWGIGTNDLGVKLFDGSGTLAGQSNNLNAVGLTGLREKIVLRNPSPGIFTSSVFHTANTGTPQLFYGGLELTVVEYPALNDLTALSGQSLADARSSLSANLLLPEGSRFKPDAAVTRLEFSEALVRAGLTMQYSTASPLYSDVRDAYSRSSIESVQTSPNGKLIFDAENGGKFYPHTALSKLAAAVALVRAAGLEAATNGAVLPLSVTDASTIPVQWRGHVAVALQNGLITLDGTKFNAARGFKRIEAASALVKIALR